MIEFTKYNNGNYWINEYGNPNNFFERKYLKSYSPLHNSRSYNKKNKNNILIINSKYDDRVTPIHSYKFTNALQKKGANIYLYEIDSVGHRFNKSKRNEVYTNIYSFINFYTNLSSK
jgi:prolyl oligopeptidase